MVNKNIVFVENKFKTSSWQKIAVTLSKHGYKIFWIVQNPLFKPSFGTVYKIPFPCKKDLVVTDQYLELAKKDRNSYFFGNPKNHYTYYSRKIQAIIEEIKPLCVFGETTLFHEVLTSNICEDLGIQYLHPATCRYPVGRFSFYHYTSLIPINEQIDVPASEDDYSIADSIVSRKTIPDYMKKKGSILFDVSYKLRIARNLFSSLLTWLIGERYNTPSPYHKFMVARKVKKLKNKWERDLVTNVCEIDSWDKIVVLPLQMQPESNIDVWGYPYNDQTENFKDILKNLPEGWKLLIKPNPKAKYELSENLVQFIETNPNVIAVSHFEPMETVFDKAKFFYSVSGTVTIEAIMAHKYAMASALPILKHFLPTAALNPKSIKMNEVNLKDVERVDAGKVIAYLRANSFEGIVGDKIHNPASQMLPNIDNLANAFLEVLSSLEKSHSCL